MPLDDPTTPRPSKTRSSASAPLPFDALDLSPQAVRRRIAWARRVGRPRYVWPHVVPDDWRRARRLLADVVAAVTRVTGGRLIGAPAGAASLVRPPDLPVEAVGVAAFTTGTGPLLGRWIGEGVVSADEEVARLLDLHLRHGRARSRTAERVLEATIEALRSSGLVPVVLKGAHTGRTVFPEPGVRPAADLDVLVPRARFGDAAEALVRAGFQAGTAKDGPPTLELTPAGASREIRSLDLGHAGNPLGLDLHGSLDRDFFRVRTARFGEPAPEDLGPLPGVDGALALRWPLLAAFLATHASHGLHSLTLLRILELVAVMREGDAGTAPGADALLQRLNDAGAVGLVLPAFAMAEALVPGTVHQDLMDRIEREATPRTRRVVRRLRPGAVPSLDRFHLDERLMWGSSPLDHLRRLLDSLWPRSEGDSAARRRRVWKDRLRVLLGGWTRR